METHQLEGDFYDYLHQFDQTDEGHNQDVLAFYVPHFEGCQRVLDIGCGEGQFIELLSDAGVDAIGIDIDSRMVESCRRKGFDVVEADLFDYLPRHPGEFDGIFSSNLIEHLSAQDATRFVRLSFEALTPGGVFLTATPNPESLIVHLHEFWRDATHVRPYNRVLVEFLLSWAGFIDVTSGENERTAWSPPPDLEAVPDLLKDLSPQEFGGWDLTLPEIPEPAGPATDASFLGRVKRSLRRRLARFLAQTVLFEEFSMVNEQLQQAASELKGLATTNQRIERALYHAQMKPLLAPREIFATGVRPTGDEAEPGDNSAYGSDPQTAGQDEVSTVEEAPSTARPEGTPGGDRTGLKIAVFTPYLPYPPDTGGKIRSYYLLRALSARFDVDLYTVYYDQGPAEEDIEALEKHCRRVVTFQLEKKQRPRHRIWRALVPTPRAVDYFHTADSLTEARKHLEAGAYDAIVIDEMCMTPYGELVEDVPRLVTVQKVDYAHYQEVAQARPWGLEKILDHIEARQIRQYGREKMPLYSAYLACSQQDVDKIHQDTPNIPALVIANGVDLAEFVPSDDNKAEKPTLLYVGSMNYYPNIDAMEFFFEEMYEPLMRRVPDVQMKIVGHAPPPEIERLGRLPNVEVTGSVPDVQPYYDEATVFVVPLRLGGGTRLKILEAMAMELPVISTSVGAEGLNIHPGEDILIADDAETFVESTIRLLSDPDLYARIKAGGRRLAEEYDWLEICAPWADLVQEVAEKANV